MKFLILIFLITNILNDIPPLMKDGDIIKLSEENLFFNNKLNK